MLPLKDALLSAAGYAVQNPSTMLAMAKHAAGLRFAVPLDAIRWGVAQFLTGDSAPTDITIEAHAPAIGLGATASMYGQKMRVDLDLQFTELELTSEQLRLVFRVKNLALEMLGKPNHPLAKMIAAGAMDLSKPAQLMGMMGAKPPFMVSAKDDTFELDLMRIPAISDNVSLRVGLEAVTPVINLQAVETDRDFLVFALKATPSGIGQTLATLRSLMPLR